LTDILTDTGISGHSIVFTYTPAALKPTAGLIQNFEALFQGDALAPAEVEQKLAKRFRLLGPQGLVGIALAAIDMALWDALARVHSMPLVRLLGGVEKPVRAYGAIGYDGVPPVSLSSLNFFSGGRQLFNQKHGRLIVDNSMASICQDHGIIVRNIAAEF
jgi:mandelate racemase